ncbi:MAG: hypothetical protein H3C35_12260, partial [Bacteroidetes bacterium]|nr:hypothetical protein [Bacteroidota bacterium]
LIPFIVFAGFGAALMLTELGYWYYEDMWNAVNRYWPLLIIFFGVWILFFRKRPA